MFVYSGPNRDSMLPAEVRAPVAAFTAKSATVLELWFETVMNAPAGSMLMLKGPDPIAAPVGLDERGVGNEANTDKTPPAPIEYPDTVSVLKFKEYRYLLVGSTTTASGPDIPARLKGLPAIAVSAPVVGLIV